MNLKTFKKIAAQVAELEKSKIKFDIAISGDYYNQQGAESALFEPIHYEVTSLRQLADVQAITGKPVKLKDYYNKVNLAGLQVEKCVASAIDLYKNFKVAPGSRLKYPTLKLMTDFHGRYWHGMSIQMISSTPTEVLEDEITYRYIGDDNTCTFCIPHTHPMYNYLDKGFFFMHINKHNEKERFIITNELNVDTYLVMLMVFLQPAFAKQLPNECFINFNLAKLLRVKFEKALLDQWKASYAEVKDMALKEYEKIANSNILQRLADGKIPHTTYNNIRLTQDSATYETISIESPELMKTLQNCIAFDDRTDIYTIIRDYVAYVIQELEDEDLKHNIPQPVNTGDVEADQKATDEWLKKIAEIKTAEYAVKINGMNVAVKRTSENTRRYVNDVMINKAELDEVMFQASCYDDQELYDKFVKSVGKMSLKWHKALADGIPVKLGALNIEEYKRPEAPTAAPRIRFRKDGDDFKLVLSKDEAVKVKFSDCLRKLATLNRKTNNSYTGAGYARRSTEWAKGELARILKEVCTFDKKNVEIVEIDEPEYTETVENGVPVKTPVLNDDGTPKTKKVKQKNVTVTTECLLTDEQSKFVGKMAEEFQKKAIERSKIFLETAIKNTDAKLIQFNGEDGYLVEGKLHKYVVNARTNQVSNYDRKNYICIVEHGGGHQVAIGFDALAARLYALKSDSVMVGKIATLQHA